MKNQILDPMTCDLQVGDVVEVISGGNERAKIIEIDGVRLPYHVETEYGFRGWAQRDELRLVERNGQPINQPEKTMKTSEQLQNLAKNVASLVEAISEAADMAEYFEANENGENAMREINKHLGNRVDELEAKLHELRNVERRNESLAEQVKILTELNIKHNANERAYQEQLRSLSAQIEGLEDRVDELEAILQAKSRAYKEQIYDYHRVIEGLEEQKQIQHERNQELLDKLKASNLLVESQRELLNTPGYIGLMMYVSEFSAKHQLSTSAVWDMFFSVCKRAVFTIPEAPEPVDNPYDFDEPETDETPRDFEELQKSLGIPYIAKKPPVVDDFKECRGGFDCNGVPYKVSPKDLSVSEDYAISCTLNVGDIVEVLGNFYNKNVNTGEQGIVEGREDISDNFSRYKVKRIGGSENEYTFFHRETLKLISRSVRPKL